MSIKVLYVSGVNLRFCAKFLGKVSSKQIFVKVLGSIPAIFVLPFYLEASLMWKCSEKEFCGGENIASVVLSGGVTTGLYKQSIDW